MTLPAEIDEAAYNALDPLLQKEYKKDGEVYRPDISPVGDWQFRDTGPITRALNTEREAAKALRTELKPWQDLGKTPDEAKTALERKPGDKGPDAKEQVEAALREAATTHKTAMEAERAKTQMYFGEVQRLLVDSQVAKILSEEDTKGAFDLLIEPIRSRAKVEMPDGSDKFVVRLVDEAGGTMYSKGQDTDGTVPMQLKEYIKSMKSDARYGRAFDGTDQSGSGSPGNKTGLKTGAKVDPSLPATERLAAARRGGA